MHLKEITCLYKENIYKNQKLLLFIFINSV